MLCRERVEELEPSIRYCLHKVGESKLQTSELLDIGEMEGPALDLFKSKLEVDLFLLLLLKFPIHFSFFICFFSVCVYVFFCWLVIVYLSHPELYISLFIIENCACSLSL